MECILDDSYLVLLVAYRYVQSMSEILHLFSLCMSDVYESSYREGGILDLHRTLGYSTHTPPKLNIEPEKRDRAQKERILATKHHLSKESEAKLIRLPS